ncbi:MAG: CAP domain-containing protein [Anaerolineaceae bacterium]
MRKTDSIILIIALMGVITLAFGMPGLAIAKLQSQEGNNGLWAVNVYRTLANVAPVVGDPVLTEQCMLHAAYMTENKEASLEEDASKSLYSPEGSICAGNALIYLLPPNPQSLQANRTVDAWLESPTHRMWLLYPTLAAVGYGYKVTQVNDGWVTGAALDVLSGIDFNADSVYPNWPARYPAPGQVGIPTVRMPVTVWWPYAGPAPAINLTTTTLTTEAGVKLAFTSNNNPNTYGGHKHITLIPDDPLTNNTIFVVHLEGTYSDQPFTYEWKFSTGTTAIPE